MMIMIMSMNTHEDDAVNQICKPYAERKKDRWVGGDYNHEIEHVTCDVTATGHAR